MRAQRAPPPSGRYRGANTRIQGEGGMSGRASDRKKTFKKGIDSDDSRRYRLTQLPLPLSPSLRHSSVCLFLSLCARVCARACFAHCSLCLGLPLSGGEKRLASSSARRSATRPSASSDRASVSPPPQEHNRRGPLRTWQWRLGGRGRRRPTQTWRRSCRRCLRT